MKYYNAKGMNRIAVMIVALLGMVILTTGCKVQDAPGAYAKAQNPVAKEKMTKVAADTISVIPVPEVIVRKRGGSGETTLEPVKMDIANEPSTEVTADPVIAVVEVVEKQEKDTVVTSERAETAKNDEADNAEKNKETAKTTEPEVTRQERFSIVEGQKDAELKEYNVVIGSFGKKENAERLKSEMKGADYNPVIIVNERGMFRVVLASYDTYQEAKAKIAGIMEEFPDAWCLVQLRAKD